MTRQYATKIPRDKATEKQRRARAVALLEAGSNAFDTNKQVKVEFGMGLSAKWLRRTRASIRKAEGLKHLAERKALATELLKKGMRHDIIHRKVKKLFGAGYDMTKLAALRVELGLPSGAAKGTNHRKKRGPNKRPYARRVARKVPLSVLEDSYSAGSSWTEGMREFRKQGGKISNKSALAIFNSVRPRAPVKHKTQLPLLPLAARDPWALPVEDDESQVDYFLRIVGILKTMTVEERSTVKKAIVLLESP